MVRLEGVGKSFGDERVLDSLDLAVARGEKLAIIGSSGSGKSTILRLVMALDEIDSGRLEIEGERMFFEQRDGELRPTSESHKRRLRERVGMVFQHFNLFPHMSALENVAEAPRRVLGLSKEEAEGRAREYLGRVGLAGKEASRPAQLSGGQQQRVAIARALAMEPDVMLFDEVTSGLDPELVGEVLEVLRDLAEESDMTMLIVTHQMHFAEDIADRVVFLDGGRIVEEGSPEQIFSDPEKQRTREFLESILEA